MDGSINRETLHEFRILEQIEKDPETPQADLASRLGVAVGTVNWYVKRLVNKGHVKVTRLQRRSLKYLITPEGLAEKTRLTLEYVRVSMVMYRATRHQAQALLSQAKQAGHERIRIEGEGDLLDVCRLTCLEQSINVDPPGADDSLPVLRVSGAAVRLEMPEG